MDPVKFDRVKEGYKFFKAIAENRVPERDIKKVAIERICDTVGKFTFEELSSNFEDILTRNNININEFILDMYDIKFLRFAGPLMKTVNDVELTIKIYAECFKIIKSIGKKDDIKDYTIIFSPDKHEEEFVKHFRNEDFFECSKKIIEYKKIKLLYKNVMIGLFEESGEKIIQISIV